ncbi:MAG: hypothetical protein Ct9H300mP14_09260 [Gammaproteobacteria bacterium]|nr:MAG: hypothetical protein Ct9H300mP14_09260 [Gammaproteobacteria bacterium]
MVDTSVPTPFQTDHRQRAGETNYLQGYRHRFSHLTMTSHNGPLTLIEGDINESEMALAARIAARFGQGPDAKTRGFVRCRARSG